MAWTQEKIQTVLEGVAKKAQEDKAFREKLKDNPREVLIAEANEAIPESIRIAVVDQNDTDIVITLPKIESDELSDSDLEHVAGGKSKTEKTCTAVGNTVSTVGVGTIAVTGATGVGAVVGVSMLGAGQAISQLVSNII